MTRLQEYVVFDLETNADKPHPAEHEIIQIGAVQVIENVVATEFNTLVRPQRRLPPHITELTGLEYGELEHAPALQDALPEFLEWVKDRPMIAHNGLGYDFIVLDSVIDALGVEAPGPRLDTLELAHVVYPRAGNGIVPDINGERPPPGRNLDQLAEWFGIDGRDKHDALNDAHMAHQLLLCLLAELNAEDPVRRLQRWILTRSRHPWGAFVDLQPEPVPLDVVVPETSEPEPIAPTGRFDIDALTASFGEGGSLITRGRIPRPQQAEMAESVARAIADRGNRLMVEAPTGTGKTLAYLVPAIEAARSSGRVSVVAPHSRVLQDQILETLAELESVLAPFTSVVLKGRQNYMSIRALQSELDWLTEEAEQPPDDRTALVLAILCGWAAVTPSGDWSDLRTTAIEKRIPILRRLQWLLRVDTPPGPVRSRLDELDFYRRARAGVKSAHVAVLNHALVADNPVLDTVEEFNLIIDEAHNLEDSATGASTRQLSVAEIEMMCDSMWDPDSRRGLVARIAVATGTGLRDDRIGRLRSSVESVRQATDRLSEPLVNHVRDRTGASREHAAHYGVSYRIVRGVDCRHQTYRQVEDAGRVLRDTLHELAEALDEIGLDSRLVQGYRKDTLEDEKARLGNQARQMAELVDAVLWAEPQLRLQVDSLEELTPWINIAEASFKAASDNAEDRPENAEGADEPGKWVWNLKRAPLSVAGILTDLWNRASSVVLTSATLRTGDSFGYLQSRLGLEGVGTEIIPSPFGDLDQRHLVLLTDYLPAPRGQLIDRFTEEEAGEIPRLCVASDGGALVLMTAHSRLAYVREHARPALAAAEIVLLAQGDGSPAALVERMRAGTDACLLGTRSFWEGVDISGEALRLLIIEKIPFDPLGDPVIGARKALLELHGKDPFSEYLVPRAAIAFAQGTGRLIRSESDIGVTVVLDNRMCRPLPYVDVIRRSLAGPPAIRDVGEPSQAYQQIAQHLGYEMDDARWERINRMPNAATLSRTALDLADAGGQMDDAEIERRLEHARQWLGFDRWRPGQYEAMSRFMRGEDVVAVLPTGSGKSVTYQIPALVSPGVTLVVSPLIALMRDQVDNLRSRGVSEVAAIYSGVPQAEQEEVLRSAARGDIKLLYVSPERLWSPIFCAQLQEVDVARIAVDEAHCISLWGHAFRPEYAIIPRALAAATSGRRIPVAAVTATATAEVLDDIAELLDIEKRTEPLHGSVDRPEIRYYVERCSNRRDRDLRVVQVLEAFRHRSAIVYVPSRNDTYRLAALLGSFGHRVRPYSGAMELSERQHTEDAFRHDEIDVVVATKAFGLGIDKPDIELIVHLEMPASIEEYVQETGRAARGARDETGPAVGTAVLLTTRADCRIHEYFIESSVPDLTTVEQAWSELTDHLNFIDPDKRSAGRPDTKDGESDESLGLALHYLEQVGAVRRQRDFVLRGRTSTLDATEQRLQELRLRDTELASRADDVLQLATGENGEYRGKKWARILDQRPDEVESTVIKLSNLGICSFSAWRFGWTFERMTATEPDWSRLGRLISERKAVVRRRAQQARAFAHSNPACRRREMLRYLGDTDLPESTASRCGGCDACTPELPRPWRDAPIDLEDAATLIREEAEPIVLILLDGVEGGQFSRRNLKRTLRGAGGGQYPLPEQLRMHGCYGRLSLLDDHEIQDFIEGLIEQGWVEAYTPAGRKYRSLRLTAEGRQRLRDRYPR